MKLQNEVLSDEELEAMPHPRRKTAARAAEAVDVRRRQGGPVKMEMEDPSTASGGSVMGPSRAPAIMESLRAQMRRYWWRFEGLVRIIATMQSSREPTVVPPVCPICHFYSVECSPEKAEVQRATLVRVGILPADDSDGVASSFPAPIQSLPPPDFQ
ncbi:hypothetical protein NE237_020367 [Protea cynaroides]|uniref:Uncharacterized protein n=1 Tax=Protea cynaroides TaxID=273540 RepID=A0A9Q0H5X3_9MAGN|nr:hypothetical protein NE237_020367 [Protea cynaroides]